MRKSFPEKTYIGIDNGVTGSIGIVSLTGSQQEFFKTPTFSCINYQKQVKNINRVDVAELRYRLRNVQNPIAFIERPMVNPGRFSASTSALRALEATLIVLEELKIPYQFIDSKEWQKEMLPKGIKGADVLKKASLGVGARLFPQFTFKGDADGMLIAEWARRNML